MINRTKKIALSLVLLASSSFAIVSTASAGNVHHVSSNYNYYSGNGHVTHYRGHRRNVHRVHYRSHGNRHHRRARHHNRHGSYLGIHY